MTALPSLDEPGRLSGHGKMTNVADPSASGARSRPERLAEDIESQILDERLPAGERFALRSELIDRFGVSPGVMNEALRILRERSIISVKPGAGGGIFISQPPPQIRLGAIDLWFRHTTVDVVDLFTGRSLLEDSLARAAVERATPADVRDLEWVLDEMRSTRHDPRLYLDANMRFHAAVARAARIDVLTGMYDLLVTSVRSLLVRAEFATEDADEILAHNFRIHGAIARAIRTQDHAALDEALLGHHIDLVRAPHPAPRHFHG